MSSFQPFAPGFQLPQLCELESFSLPWRASLSQLLVKYWGGSPIGPALWGRGWDRGTLMSSLAHSSLPRASLPAAPGQGCLGLPACMQHATQPVPTHQGDWSLAPGTILDFPCSLPLAPGSLQLHAFLPSGALLLAWAEVAAPASQFSGACLRPTTHRDSDTGARKCHVK